MKSKSRSGQEQGRATKEEQLGTMYNLLCETLIEKLRTGDISGFELGVVRQLLKDNGISSIPKPGNKLDDLLLTLPTEFNLDEVPDSNYALHRAINDDQS